MKKIILGLVLVASLAPLLAQEKWTCFTDDKLISADHGILGIFEYTEGSIWLVTSGGIHILDGNEWQKINKKTNILKKVVSSYLVDSKNRIWVGSHPEIRYGPEFLNTFKNGVAIYEGDEWEFMSTKDMGFKAPVVTRMFESKNGDIWLGVSSHASGAERNSILSKGAVLRFSNGSWEVYKAKDFPCLYCEFVKGFYEDKNGRLWLWGTDGMTYFEDGKFHRVYKEDGYLKSSRRITQVLEDSDKNFWVAGFGRVARYDGKQWTTFSKEHGIPSSNFPPSGLTESNDGQILLTTRNGIYRYDGKDTWSHEKIKFVNSGVFPDSKDRLWIPTYKGLKIQEGTNSTVEKDIIGVWDFIEDKQGAVWAFTGKDGIRRLKDGQWTHFNKKNKLPSDKIRFAHLTDDDVLWVATNKGICKCEYE